MASRVCVWLHVSLLIAVCSVQCKVTMEQLQQSAQMIRSVCQPKWNISTEMADGILKGNFPNDRAMMCYVHCVLELTMIMKKNKITYNAAIKSMDMLLPDEYAIGAKSSLTTCKDVGNGIKDACAAAYAIVQCIYKNSDKFTFV